MNCVDTAQQSRQSTAQTIQSLGKSVQLLIERVIHSDLNKLAVSFTRILHLLHVFLVQYLLHRQLLDDSPRPPMERRALLFRIAGASERDEEPALSAAFAFAFHDGFELVAVGAGRHFPSA